MKTVILALFLVAVASAEFPSFVNLCKRDSKLNDCIKNNINGAKGQLKNGIPSLFVPKSDPLVIDPDTVYQTPTLKITSYKGFSYTGPDTFNVQNVNLDLEKNILKVDWVWDSLVARGKYKFEGNLLQFEVNGGGECLVKLNNLGISLTMTGDREEKDGKSYLIFKKNDIKLELSKLEASYNFANLFPSAEQTEAVNKLMNENQKATTKAFQLVIEKTGAAIATNSIQKLFETYSIEELFPL